MNDVRDDYEGEVRRCEEINEGRMKAMQRHLNLSKSIREAREGFCKVGTRKTKLLLNKLGNGVPNSVGSRR